MKDPSKTLDHLKNILEGLCCPYIEESNEQWLAELLLHPSEARLKLLHWLVTTYDKAFNELLDNTIPVISNRVDSRHQKLLLILNLMGVCKIDDLELVRGTASHKKQLKFWSLLIQMCYISQYGSPYQYHTNTSVEESFYLKPARQPTQHESFDQTCKFIDSLLRQCKMNQLFSSHTKSEIEEMHTTSLPTIDMLIETGETMRTDIKNTVELLQKVKQTEVDVEKFDQTTVENYCRKIDLSLNMFSQMIDSSIHCYDNEIDTWCNKPKPHLSELGPMLKSVTNMCDPQNHLYEHLKTLNRSTKYLTSDLKKDLSSSVQKIHDGKRMIDGYRESIAVLEESIRRHARKE